MVSSIAASPKLTVDEPVDEAIDIMAARCLSDNVIHKTKTTALRFQIKWMILEVRCQGMVISVAESSHAKAAGSRRL